jgi:hypothetical protein
VNALDIGLQYQRVFAIILTVAFDKKNGDIITTDAEDCQLVIEFAAWDSSQLLRCYLPGFNLHESGDSAKGMTTAIVWINDPYFSYCPE